MGLDTRSSTAITAALAGLLLVGGLAPTAAAKVFHSQKEAIALAFPDADRVEQETYILSADQVESIEQMARCELDSRIVKIYTGWRGSEVLGHAHIDVHTVRTKPEGFMVVVDPGGVVTSFRMLAFHEPIDYLPTNRWYTQFTNKTIERSEGGDEQRRLRLRLGHDIHGVVGATLSARAATEGVRRALAYYEVLLRTQD